MKRIYTFIAALMLVAPTLSAHAANPVVEIKTTAGDIRIELYPDKAPKTVDNFLQYAKDGFYAGTVFHRVIPNFMIQGGGFDKTYSEKPTTRAPLVNEAANGLRNEVGTIAMARTPNPNSARAQFFINVNDNQFLNYRDPSPQGIGYAVFGKVIAGMDVVQKIAATPTGAGGPFPKDVPTMMIVIESVKLVPPAEAEKQ
jgi:peptidyl-prolyl cis-trans isomerase A (cyclophilin A)/peptidyl-prolyl cis-trans isomerase B (cyclophilin B)